MQHYKNLLIYCCYGVMLVATAVGLRQVYYGPDPDDPAKKRMKRLILIACSVMLIFGIGAVIIQWVF
jgi:hypothetical protein